MKFQWKLPIQISQTLLIVQKSFIEQIFFTQVHFGGTFIFEELPKKANRKKSKNLFMLPFCQLIQFSWIMTLWSSLPCRSSPSWSRGQASPWLSSGPWLLAPQSPFVRFERDCQLSIKANELDKNRFFKLMVKVCRRNATI